jgi:hypothetical protein
VSKRRTPELITLQENFRAEVVARDGRLRPCYFRAKDDAVPEAVEEFVADWGLESELDRKCPQQKGNGG